MGQLDAQDTLKIDFGRISMADFNQTIPKEDTAAGALIIADIGKTYYEGNKFGYLEVVFKRFMRVKILKRNGVGIGSYSLGRIYANQEIADRNDSKGSAESITELMGSTFNLENGIIQETKLDAGSVFDEKSDGDLTVKKFAMPALKEGSMYDVTYTIRSIFQMSLRPWSFQYEYPCLWSEYQVRIPSSFHYRMKLQGDQHFDINSSKSVEEKFKIEFGGAHGASMGDVRMTGVSSQRRWVKKNIPALIKEPYVNTANNFIDRVSFQLEYFQWNDHELKEFDYSDWPEACKTIFKRNDFEESLNGNNFWMDKTIDGFKAKARGDDEMIRQIYFFVRDQFSCTGSGYIFSPRKLADIFKSRTGTHSEINLLLIAMLRHAKISADPAVLSTRENGQANYEIPMIGEYNYLICVTENDTKTLRLDASRRENPFDKLLPDCYNGGARVLNVLNPRFVPLIPDSVLETRRTNVFISSDEKGEVSGSVATVYGSDQSYLIREEIRKTSKKEYFSKILRKNEAGMESYNEELESVDNTEQPVVLKYELNISAFQKSDIIYFSPVMIQSFTTNPLTSETRRFPVEMTSRMDYIYLLSMDIPKGFKIDEIPASTRIKLNENQGVFEYIIQQNEDNIQMQVHLKLNKSVFSPEEYQSLRDFFGYVVKKESEQIVFKKNHS